MNVGHICTRNVHTARSIDTVRQAAAAMRDWNVGTVVVLDKRDKPLGILTDRDIATKITAEGRDPRDVTVEEIMTLRPDTIGEDAPLEFALARMRSNGCRRLPVTNAGGAVVGIVSLDDVLRVMADEMAQVARLLEAEAPRTVHGTSFL